MTRTKTFRSIAEVVVPETRALTPAEWQQFADVIDTALSKRPKAMQRQLGVFLKLLNVMAFTHTGRSLSSLSLDDRTAFLANVENSRVLLFRRGFWGIRTLVFMGYYARPECATSLGYAAAARGWELRR